MKGNPFLGVGYLFRGFRLVTKPGIRQFVIIPLLINTLLFSLLIWFGADQFNALISAMLPSWLDWLEWLLWPLFAVTVSIFVFFTFIHIANFIGAPFNALLAERIEKELKGKLGKEPFQLRHFLSTLWPSLCSEFRKIAYFLIRSVPLLVLFLIPWVNIIASFVWIVFSAWMLALEYADYPMANHDILFAEQQKRLREKRFMVLGFGGAALFLLMIPVLNFFAMPIAVSGATVMWLEQFDEG